MAKEDEIALMRELMEKTAPPVEVQPDGLSIAQENAIDLLITGKTDAEVAKTVGVARQTVNLWRNHDRLFQAVLTQRRRAMWSANLERMRGLVGAAFDVLEANLQSDDPKLRQAAAVTILKACRLQGGSFSP